MRANQRPTLKRVEASSPRKADVNAYIAFRGAIEPVKRLMFESDTVELFGEAGERGEEERVLKMMCTADCLF